MQDVCFQFVLIKNREVSKDGKKLHDLTDLFVDQSIMIFQFIYFFMWNETAILLYRILSPALLIYSSFFSLFLQWTFVS